MTRRNGKPIRPTFQSMRWMLYGHYLDPFGPMVTKRGGFTSNPSVAPVSMECTCGGKLVTSIHPAIVVCQKCGKNWRL